MQAEFDRVLPGKETRNQRRQNQNCGKTIAVVFELTSRNEFDPQENHFG